MPRFNPRGNPSLEEVFHSLEEQIASDPSEGAEFAHAVVYACLQGLENRLPQGEYASAAFGKHLAIACEHLEQAVEAVHGRSNPRGARASSKVQSVLIPTDSFTMRQARKWVDEHGYADHGVDETDQYYRFRQFDPDKRHGYRTIEFGDSGIKAVIQVPKKPRRSR